MTTPTPVIGRIGRYELLARIGSGGMGEVFLARTTGAAGFESRVVIKRILPHLANNPDFVRRFVDEGKLVVKLRHAGIAQVLDLGEDGGAVYLAMEYVDGRDLRELIRLSGAAQRPIPREIACTILASVLEALDYAHRATDDSGRSLGIIHRDVSPSNVMVSRAGNVKLLDFGIARAAERLSASISGAIQGKFSYMSPQQAAGTTLDARSDQFSAGVMGWELLTGQRPFDGSTDLDTLDRIRHAEPGSLAEAAPGAPPELAAAIGRMLAKKPEDRFDSADDARRAILAQLDRDAGPIGARELAAWVAEIEATLPPGLRQRPSAGLSLDDALRLSLENSDSIPQATRTISTISTSSTSSADSGPAGANPPPPPSSYPHTPSAPPAYAPTTPADAAALAQPVITTDTGAGAPNTVSQVVVPASRSRLTVLLVLLNLLLLGSVAWLVYQSTRPTAGEVPLAQATDASPAPTAEEARDSATTAATETLAPHAPAEATVGPDAGESVEADVDAGAPADAGPEIPPSGAVAGGAIAAAATSFGQRAVEFVVTASPSHALITIRDHGSGTGPRKVWIAKGETLSATVRAEGYVARSVVLDPAQQSELDVVLRQEERGEVTFRYFPANAQIRIDGRPVQTGGSNLVQKSVPVGTHTLTIVATGGRSKDVRFTVRAGQTTNLKTLTVDTAAEDEP